MRILFLTARLPGPFRGDQVRAYHQLRLLGARHEVTLVSFADPDEPAAGPGPLAPTCARVVTVALSWTGMVGAGLRGALSGLPLQAAVYRTRGMQQAIRDALGREQYDVAHLQLVRMAPYLGELGSLPRVIDLVDALSLNMERRARVDRGLARWVAGREAKRLRRYERSVCDAVDRALVGSRIDRDALGAPPNLVVLSSGVDPDAFPFGQEARERATVILSGNMGYFPNIRAALWLARSILPIVARAIPAVRLRIVGARPDRRVRRLARADPRITVSGPVDDVGSHLRCAAVAVAPVQAGSGQQLKVLEAMASGTPVVATSVAAGGLDVRHGEHLLVGDDAETFAAHVIRVLREPSLAAELAAQGRRLVEDRYTWERSVSQLEEIYAAVVSGRRG